MNDDFDLTLNTRMHTCIYKQTTKRETERAKKKKIEIKFFFHSGIFFNFRVTIYLIYFKLTHLLDMFIYY